MNNTVQKQKLSTATKSNVIAMLVSEENELVEINFSIDSGRVVTREKIDTVTQVYHPGIVLGNDIFGQTWVAHNHYSNKRPICETMDKYALGQQLYWDDRPEKFSRTELVHRAIDEVIDAKSYDPINYNCQIFVNKVVADEHVSESVDNLANIAIVGGALLGLLGGAFDNKALKIAGGVIAVTGVAAKVYSRYDKK